MLKDPNTTRRPMLDPVDRISEVWFGLVMVLTFTCSLSVIHAGRDEVRSMLVEALGCNLAWGIIDAFLYLICVFVERSRSVAALNVVRTTGDRTIAHRVIAQAMPPLLAVALSPSGYEEIGHALNQLEDAPERAWLDRSDWLAALAVFLLVFLSTFPVVIPFALISQPRLALRVSNAVAILMMFLSGFAFGRHANYRPWTMGISMVLVGGALVALTIALGG